MSSYFSDRTLGTLRHFQSDQRDRAARLKRGGGVADTPLDDPAVAEQLADPAGPAPDAYFDRQWALAIMGRALEAVAAEHVAAGRGALFEALKGTLQARAEPASHAALAAQLGLSEGAVKVAAHRLRRRFREAVLAEISRTVSDPADADLELRHLAETLVRSAEFGEE
jgi:DNA-directed RNA polymerase specialized sigma24 family protein